MKHSIVKTYAVLLVLIGLTSACSGPAQSSDSSDANAGAPQQANSNSAGQPQGAQSDAPSAASGATPLLVQPIPPTPGPNPPEKSAAKPASEAPVSSAKAPKLVAPAKKIDFGRQPQDKTLIRAIVIKNGGRENLNIESVTPS